jgi:carbonic anhydrase
MKLWTPLATSVCAAALGVGCAPAGDVGPAASASPEPVKEVMTAEAQQSLTPAQVLADLQAGNLRFAEGRLTPRDYPAQVAATSEGQYPKAVVLSCLDSRVPVETIFDQGIGDLFVGRVAGNIEDVDMLGSFEFATKVAGSKLIVVLGHTSCGAIKGAAAGVEMANLTELLAEFDGALEKADEMTDGPADPSNADFIDAAVEENVRITMKDLVERSPIIAELVESGDVAIAGGVYDLATGRVTWLDS